MGLEYIDIGNPGAPNTDPATGQPYNPAHLLIPAHINQPGGTLVLFNNSTNDLFFTFPYNRYRIKVPATQKRQIRLQVQEPQGISYVVGTATAILVGQPDVYIECYAPDECVPPFNEGASGVAVASAGIPVTVAACKGVTLTGTFNNPFGPDTVIDIFAPAAGLYMLTYTIQQLDSNTNPADYIEVLGGNNNQPGFFGKLTHPLYQAQNTPAVWYYAEGSTPFAGPTYWLGANEVFWAAEGDELVMQVGVSNSSGLPFVNNPSLRIDAALVLMQPY